LGEVGGAAAFQLVGVDATAVDVAHVEDVAVLLGVGVGIEVRDPAVGGLLVLVLDDGADRPGVRGVRAALADVVAGLDEVPQVVDDAGGYEEAAFGIDGDAPGVAGALREDLKLARAGVDPPESARELPSGMVGLVVGVGLGVADMTVVENSVKPVEPAVGSPGERVGQLVGVGAAKAGDDDFGLVGLAVAVGVLKEQDVGGVRRRRW
jgi:hypothetical protein